MPQPITSRIISACRSTATARSRTRTRSASSLGLPGPTSAASCSPSKPQMHVAVIGIAHFNKKDDIKSALLRVSDSIAYVAAARHVYAVLDDPDDRNSKLFVKAKNNLAADKNALRYGFGAKTVGHDADLGVDITAPFVIWHPQHVEI